jgi:hypothetical protein
MLQVMKGWSIETVNVIHYQDSIKFQPKMYTFENDSLILRDLCADCFEHL